jgi:hypothetical protein
MNDETESGKEKISSGGGGTSQQMTLQKAVDLGEYNPKYLANFPEWHKLSKFLQLQFIRQGLDNHEGRLMSQWSELANELNYRDRPALKQAQENIMKQIKKVQADRERLYIEYTKE